MKCAGQTSGQLVSTESGGYRLPQERLPVRKIKEVLRLHALGLSQRQIALSCSVGQATVAHRGLKRLVAHPVLHGPHVESPSQHSCGIGGTKCLQIKLCRVEFGALRDRFAVIEHVLLTVSGRGWEHKLAVRAMRMLPKLF